MAAVQLGEAHSILSSEDRCISIAAVSEYQCNLDLWTLQ
jgi:hypothetical protein